jgi:hypothetical protein
MTTKTTKTKTTKTTETTETVRFVDRTKPLPKLTLDRARISNVYRGEVDTCTCGCAGDYFYRGKRKDRAGFESVLKDIIRYANERGGEVELYEAFGGELYLQAEIDEELCLAYFDAGYDPRKQKRGKK